MLLAAKSLEHIRSAFGGDGIFADEKRSYDPLSCDENRTSDCVERSFISVQNFTRVNYYMLCVVLTPHYSWSSITKNYPVNLAKLTTISCSSSELQRSEKGPRHCLAISLSGLYLQYL